MIKALSVLGITSLLGGGALIYALNQPLNNGTPLNDTQGCQTHAYAMHNDDCQNGTGESLLNDGSDAWQCPYGNETCIGSESCGETCYNDRSGCHQNRTEQHNNRSMHHQRRR